MDDASREQIIAALDAWQAAEKAYHDEADKHVTGGRRSDVPPGAPEKVLLSHEALAELRRLREAAKDAQEAYEIMIGD